MPTIICEESFISGANFARELMMGEVDEQYQQSKLNWQKARKLQSDLALADSKIEAIKEMCDEHMKYSLLKQDDPFHKGIYCAYMNISNLLDKLGADK